jgi:hypothetical protein
MVLETALKEALTEHPGTSRMTRRLVFVTGLRHRRRLRRECECSAVTAVPDFD